MANYQNSRYNLENLERTKDRMTKMPTPGVNKSVLSKRDNPKELPKRQDRTSFNGLSKNVAASGGLNRTGAAPKSWTQQKFAGKMNVGDFVSLAGGLSQAIAPDTPQGRVGGVLANYAGRERARLKAEREYTDKKDLARQELEYRNQEKMSQLENRRITAANTAEYRKARLGQSGNGTSLMQNFKAAQDGGYTGTLKDWKLLSKSSGASDKFTASDLANYDRLQEMIGGGKTLAEINDFSRRTGGGEYVEVDDPDNMIPVEGTGFLGAFQSMTPGKKIVLKSSLNSQGKTQTKLPTGVPTGSIQVTSQDGTQGFIDPKTNKFYDQNGKEVVNKPIREKVSARETEKKPVITPDMPSFGAGISTEKANRLFQEEQYKTKTFKEILKDARKKSFDIRTKLYNQ